MNLDARQLRAFLALAETRNFTRAAARLHLSQPAFSALIRQLEATLGLRLFDRTTRSVVPTPDGVAFEPLATDILRRLDRAVADMRDRADARQGRVAVALLPSLAAGWLPQVLGRFLADHPGIEVAVSDVLSEPCIEQLRRGEADFAIAAIAVDAPGFRAEPFCRDDFHLVVPAGHPLATARRLRPEDVAAYPFIHLARHSSVRQYLDAATRPRVFQSMMEVEQLATVRGMIEAGIGVSIVPRLTLFHFRSERLITRRLNWPGLSRALFLIRPDARGLSVAARHLHDWLIAHRPRMN